MTRKTETIKSEYFEDKYRSDIDPWGFRNSAYEKEKYAATMHALSRDRFKNALEVGCSIGVLTELLARRCDALLAIDTSQTALAAAQGYCSAYPNVRFEAKTLPEKFPDGSFDLIVLSEVLYYFCAADLQRVAGRCMEAILPDGEIILCHWLGETDYPLSGHQASDLFAAAIARKMPARTILRDDVYRLERFSQN